MYISILLYTQEKIPVSALRLSFTPISFVIENSRSTAAERNYSFLSTMENCRRTKLEPCFFYFMRGEFKKSLNIIMSTSFALNSPSNKIIDVHIIRSFY